MSASSIFAQNVGIGSSSFTPDASAMLEIQATNKGLLIPQIDLQNGTDATTITTPATSLLVWNTGATFGDATYYYNSGTSGSPVWTKLGGSGTISGSGTADYVARWTPNGTTLGTGLIRDNGSNVAINAAPDANFMLYNNGAFRNNGFFYTSINTNVIPGDATSGLAVSWNYHPGAAGVNLWNMFNNATNSFIFHQKTGVATEKEVVKILGTGDLETSGNIVAIGKIDAAGTDKNTYVSFFSETDGTESGRIWRTPTDNGIFHMYNWGTGSMNFSTNATERMRITGTGEVGINTTTPGSYQTKIVGADGNSGLYVTKTQDLDAATYYGINAYASNPGDATETYGIYSIAQSNGGNSYGINAVTEQQGSSHCYSVAGEQYNN